MSSDLKPHMSTDEVNLYIEQLRECKSLLEFGSGGSTKLAVDLGVRSIDSVESDKKWVESLKLNNELQDAINSGRLRIHHVDIGPVKQWGAPADRSHLSGWRDYYGKIWSQLASIPDVVLVDGRWRVSCTIRSILECPSTTKIVIHDFYSRPNYHIVLGFLDTIDSVDSLGVFKRREDMDWRELCRAADQYSFDYW